MQHMKKFARIAIIPALWAVLVSGCGGGGGGDAADLDPEGGEKKKQARLEAFGKAGIPKGTGASGAAPTTGAQGAARSKAQSGR